MSRAPIGPEASAAARIARETATGFAEADPRTTRADALAAWNPVLGLELRTLLRSKRYQRALWASLLIGLTLTLTLLGYAADLQWEADLYPAFAAYFTVAAFCFPLAASTFASAMIARERERNTYESLLLTRLRPFDLVLGKSLAAVIVVFGLFLAHLPFLLCAFVLGPLSAWAYLSASCFIGLGILIGAATGLAFSAAQPTSASAAGAASAAAMFTYGLSWTYLGGRIELARQDGRTTPEALLRDGVGFLLDAPTLIGVALLVWLGIAVATTSLRPERADHSTPLKIWLLAAGFTAAIAVTLTFCLRPDAAEVFGVGLGLPLLAAALLASDRPLDARRMARAARGNYAGLFRAFGPHPLGNLRFFAAWALGFALAASAGAHLVGAAGAFVFSAELLSYAVVGIATAAAFAWLRGAGVSGGPARTGLSVGLVFVVVGVQILTALSSAGQTPPAWYVVSPIASTTLLEAQATSLAPYLLHLALYAGTAAAFYVALARRTRPTA